MDNFESRYDQAKALLIDIGFELSHLHESLSRPSIRYTEYLININQLKIIINKISRFVGPLDPFFEWIKKDQPVSKDIGTIDPFLEEEAERIMEVNKFMDKRDNVLNEIKPGFSVFDKLLIDQKQKATSQVFGKEEEEDAIRLEICKLKTKLLNLQKANIESKTEATLQVYATEEEARKLSDEMRPKKSCSAWSDAKDHVLIRMANEEYGICTQTAINIYRELDEAIKNSL